MPSRPLVLLLFVAAASRALAEESVAAEPVPAFEGYLDLADGRLSGNGRFVSGAPDRVFDASSSGLALQQAAGSLAYQPKQGLGGFLNLTLGRDADVIAAYDGSVSRRHADLTQAYAQYAAGRWVIAAGKFVSLPTPEYIWSPSNASYSRSILFGFAAPYTHTGLRLTLNASDRWTFIAGANNGWDDVRDTNDAKTLELGACWNPGTAFSAVLAGYAGRERVGGLVATGPQGERLLLDLVTTWHASDSITLVLDLNAGRQAHAVAQAQGPAGTAAGADWRGVAAYLHWMPAPHWRWSLRAEQFNDGDGYRTGLAQRWREVTLGGAWLRDRHLEVRAEARSDRSDRDAFGQELGRRPTRGQTSVALNLLLKR
ncbi:MAG: outer membrane beta-barrel protein [Proteobacteria bacterium]|nr:outer membrane beta-barrel protein [Pseudomonadota bacterium]